ncbi:MAG: WXG100 family type VII secretion target [Lacisediminihabitans sp.]
MTRYQVDSEAVLGATNAVRSSIARIQAEVGGLHGQLLGLQSSWSGQAASAFQSVVTEWKATQQRVEENLSLINQALARAGQHYAEIEASNARLFAH